MTTLLAAVCLLASAGTALGEGFPCGQNKELPPMTTITEEEAEARKCCIDLPCKYDKGCWADQMPPLYSAARAQAITRDQANQMEKELLWPKAKSGEMNKTFVSSMPEHGWWRISAPKKQFPFYYTGIQKAFKYSFKKELKITIDLDIFFVDDFDSRWANDETYNSDYPGAAYWIHNDCSNFRICYEESGYKASDFTGNGVAFILPVALPSTVDFRDGHKLMPAALELYNISATHRDENGELLKPPNREWMSPHRYNLGEIIWFNAFRWHSGHVPRKSEFIDADNPDRKRAETVGFAAEHHDGYWVLFRMCKGSTDDAVKKKILETDYNPTSTGASTEKYVLSEEEALNHNLLKESVPQAKRMSVEL